MYGGRADCVCLIFLFCCSSFRLRELILAAAHANAMKPKSDCWLESVHIECTWLQY